MSIVAKTVRQRSSWHLVLAAVGLLAGLTIMLLALQMHIELRALFSQTLSDDSQILIISKRIRTSHTLKLASATFSDAEMETIQRQPFVTDLGIFQGNLFPMGTMPNPALFMETELFIESVPTRFLDVHPDAWHWQEGDPTIPIILARDFLNLYNLVYAPSRGLPKLSEEALEFIPIPLRIGPIGQHLTMTAKIVGVTDRFSSILVPESFLNWANQQFAPDLRNRPARIAIQVADAPAESISRFLQDRGYMTNRERLRDNAAVHTVRVLLTLAGSAGVLLLGLALLVSILNSQLVISRSSTNIQLLLDLGYHPATIARTLLRDQILMLIAAAASAVLLAQVSLGQLRDQLAETGFTIAPHLRMTVLFAALIVCLLVALMQFVSVTAAVLRARSNATAR